MPKRKQPRPWEMKPDPALMNPVKVMNRIKESGIQDIQKEYTRLRDIAQKRIKRGGLTTTVPKIREMRQQSGNGYTARLAKEFAQLQRFISSPMSTFEGRKRIQEKQLAKLQEHEFEGITKENISEFGRFMEWYREKYVVELPEGRAVMFDSDTAVKVFHEIGGKITKDSKTANITRLFNEWMDGYGDEYGIEDIREVNRDAYNARRRAARAKKKKRQIEQDQLMGQE